MAQTRRIGITPSKRRIKLKGEIDGDFSGALLQIGWRELMDESILSDLQNVDGNLFGRLRFRPTTSFSDTEMTAAGVSAPSAAIQLLNSTR